MEILIKYRNDRKKEGASQAELNGLDGRINAHLSSSPPNEAKALDLELLSYRRSVAEGLDYATGLNRAEFLARLDKHIFQLLGSKPARFVEMKVKSISTDQPLSVAVDICNMTVRDLLEKACVVLGIHGSARLITQGKHHDQLDISLEAAGIRETDTVVVCKRLGCDGRCCSVSYGMLCDAMLRDTHAVFKDMSEAERHKIFVSMSKLKELIPKPVAKEPLLACTLAFEEPQGLWGRGPLGSDRATSALAALLRSTKSNGEAEAVCWALPPLKRQDGITEASANFNTKVDWAQKNDIISCSALSEPSQDKAEALKVATLCSSLGSGSGVATVINDEDLYG